MSMLAKSTWSSAVPPGAVVAVGAVMPLQRSDHSENLGCRCEERRRRNVRGLSVEAMHHCMVAAHVLVLDASEKGNVLIVRVSECICRKGHGFMNSSPPLRKRCMDLEEDLCQPHKQPRAQRQLELTAAPIRATMGIGISFSLACGICVIDDWKRSGFLAAIEVGPLQNARWRRWRTTGPLFGADHVIVFLSC